MSEQNRRTLDLEPSPADDAPREGPVKVISEAERLAGMADADKRQTEAQAPETAEPGEGAEGASVG